MITIINNMYESQFIVENTKFVNFRFKCRRQIASIHARILWKELNHKSNPQKRTLKIFLISYPQSLLSTHTFNPYYTVSTPSTSDNSIHIPNPCYPHLQPLLSTPSSSTIHTFKPYTALTSIHTFNGDYQHPLGLCWKILTVSGQK